MSTKPRIIVADNSHVMRMMHARYLEKDYEILEATNGGQTLALVEQYLSPKPTAKFRNAGEQTLGLLIVSVELPDYDGFEIARRIRQHHSMEQLPIILSTSHNRRDLIERALDVGINDYLVKPFPEELLISKVVSMMTQVDEASRKLSLEMSGIPFFKDVPGSSVARAIDTCAEVLRLAAGEVVCNQGQKNYDLFILMEGCCDVRFNGRKVSEIKPLDTIGEMGFLEEQPRSADVVTTQYSKLLVFRKEPFEAFLNNDRAISEIICKNIIHTMTDRIGKANRLIEQLKIIATKDLTY